MSYEKINDLIEQAPDVSQWWISNKRALNFWFRGFYTMDFISGGLFAIGASFSLLLFTGLAFGQVSVTNPWGLAVFPFLCGLGCGWLKLSPKWWPKRFTYNDLRLTKEKHKETVSLAFVHKILSRAVKISDPQMKPILARLHAIKDTDLPKCWWDALACEVDKCVAAQHPINESVQEKLDAVYIQIENVAASLSTPKVLRL